MQPAKLIVAPGFLSLAVASDWSCLSWFPPWLDSSGFSLSIQPLERYSAHPISITHPVYFFHCDCHILNYPVCLVTYLFLLPLSSSNLPPPRTHAHTHTHTHICTFAISAKAGIAPALFIALFLEPQIRTWHRLGAQWKSVVEWKKCM